jgi:membrane protein YdbS with pleckstrin-like domain
MTRSDLPSDSPISPATDGVGDPAPHRPSGDEEIVYYEGRPLLRGDQAKAALMLMIGIGLIALPILAMLFDWKWSGWLTLICVVLAVIVIVVPMLMMRSIRYRITSYRIDYERGILKKKIDTLELWHVEDIKFEQGLLDRIMNVGSITVLSNDKTSPRLELHGIPDPRVIFDKLKQRVIAVKRQRGVIKMDVG